MKFNYFLNECSYYEIIKFKEGKEYVKSGNGKTIK